MQISNSTDSLTNRNGRKRTLSDSSPFPWKKAEAPSTEFMAFYDDAFLYFAFRAVDADMVVLDKLRDKEDVIFEDRVEMFLSVDHQMKNYFCFEIDPRGRVFDYRMAYYRQSDPKWHCEGLETVGTTFANGREKGYVVEGRIPLATFVQMGFPEFQKGTKIRCGLYRAEFSHDQSGKPVVQEETVHNLGRKPPGTPPIEEWISWIDPKNARTRFPCAIVFGVARVREMSPPFLVIGSPEATLVADCLSYRGGSCLQIVTKHNIEEVGGKPGCALQRKYRLSNKF